MSKKNVKQWSVKSQVDVVDHETGELKTSTKSKVLLVNNEPDFVKLYLEDMLLLMKLPASMLKLILWLSKHLTYAGEEYGLCVSLSPALKELCIEQIGISSMQVLNNTLSKLVKYGVLIRQGIGLYQLNPYFVGKGNWADVSSIRLTIDYGSFGRRFNTEVDKERERSREKKHVDDDLSQIDDQERLRRMLAERLGVDVSAVEVGEDGHKDGVIYEEGNAG